MKKIAEQKMAPGGGGGVGGMQPQNFFVNLRTVMAILVLFGQFLRQILFKLVAPN